MVYFKSLLVGFAALVLAVPLLTIALVIAFIFLQKVPPGSNDQVIGWDVRTLFVNAPFLWIFGTAAILAFLAGFYWEFRRASH